MPDRNRTTYYMKITQHQTTKNPLSKKKNEANPNNKEKNLTVVEKKRRN